MKIELRLNSQMPFMDLKWIHTVDGRLKTAIITMEFTSYEARNHVRDTSKAREFALKVLNMDDFPHRFNRWPRIFRIIDNSSLQSGNQSPQLAKSNPFLFAGPIFHTTTNVF